MDRGRRQRGRRTRARRGQAPRDRTARLDAHGGICRVSGTWGRQNIIVFSQLPRGGLQKVEAAGGPCEPFTTLASGETGHQHPEFLPDGQQVMYVVERDGTREIVVRSIASGKTTSLGPSESSALYAAGHLFFARAATLVAQPFDAVTLRRRASRRLSPRRWVSTRLDASSPRSPTGCWSMRRVPDCPCPT